MSDAAMERLGRAVAVAVAGIGRPFFCAIGLRLQEARREKAAIALGLAEVALGPVAAMEARFAGGKEDGALLVQAWHEGGGITQVALRPAPEPSATLDLDGEAGSLRLNAEGALVRHAAGRAEPVTPPAAAMPGREALERLAARLRTALDGVGTG